MSSEEKRMLVYGPVPSRRLGRSLGLDLVPLKTCTFDCVYCQLGRGTGTTLKRDSYIPPDDILEAVRESLDGGADPDYITLSGSGDPTLHSQLGTIIRGIKALTGIPLALITNGSLLWDEEVRHDAVGCDLVLPSLDAGDEETFKKINRPDKALSWEKILEGLIRFRVDFGGPIWLEVMLVAGINDSEQSLQNIKAAIERIAPDKIHLNTVARLPAESWAHAVPPAKMEEIRALFGDSAEIIAEYSGRHSLHSHSPRRDEILGTLRRRPCSADDIAAGLQINRHELVKELALLESEGLIIAEEWEGNRFYRPADS